MFVWPPVRAWAVRILTFTIVATAVGVASAQAPTGTIAGVVRDPSNAAVTGARVKAMQLATGLSRTTTTSQLGDYSFPALLTGEYEVSAEAAGLKQMVRAVSLKQVKRRRLGAMR